MLLFVTQVQISDVPRLFELPDTECPTVGIRLLRCRRPKHWDNVDETMDQQERNLWSHPLAGPQWERRLREVLLQEDCEKVTFARRLLHSASLGSSILTASPTLLASFRRHHNNCWTMNQFGFYVF